MHEIKPSCLNERESMSDNVNGEPRFRGKVRLPYWRIKDTSQAMRYNMPAKNETNKFKRVKSFIERVPSDFKPSNK